MKYLTDSKTAIVFFCDGCGKKLDRQDPGQVRLDAQKRRPQTQLISTFVANDPKSLPKNQLQR